uniref:Nudix hydrolase domain-containing protein n=1 Tax=Octactis speculum TaxID=3111310 RepID=A0A7S2BMB1_9STRA
MCGLGEDEDSCLIRLDEDDEGATRGSLLDAVLRCNQYDPSNYAPVLVSPGDLQVGYVSGEMLDNLRALTISTRGGYEPVVIGPSPLKRTIGAGGESSINSEAVWLAPHEDDAAGRTRVVATLVDGLLADGAVPTDKVRNELQDVRAISSKGGGALAEAVPLLAMERAAMINFGVPSLGAHVNGYVTDPASGRPTAMWLGRRAMAKPTYPGLWDQIAAGGQPEGLSFYDNVAKECEEEATLPRDLLDMYIRPAGLVSYRYAARRGLSSKTLAVYDLPLPPGVKPSNGDGEVDEFELMSMDAVAACLRDDLPSWKPNSALVAIDFLVRHGFVGPDDEDYLDICHLLRAAP